jgi:hypothetical protein
MMALLDGSFREADVFPDIVFSGHVHNYQRFSKNYPGSKIIPYIVSGAGGYADLHKLAAPGEYDFPDDSCLLDNVELENYCDDAHGFLKIELEKNQGKIIIKGEYYITGEVSTLLHDSFRVDVER